tara:strand:+ start:32 stop:1207 length:1176 start_codon:yes stop_codon:yes gene_type:complete
MPLEFVKVTNFRTESINLGLSPSQSGGTTNLSYQDGTFTYAPQSNTIPRALLMILEPSDVGFNTSGAEGYWTLGTHDITISGNPGTAMGRWVVNPTYGSSYSHSQNPLKNFEYDPAVGLGAQFWNFNLSGSWLGEAYVPTHGQPATYYKRWLGTSVINGSGYQADMASLGMGNFYDACASPNENPSGILPYTSPTDGSTCTSNKDAWERWHPLVDHVTAVNSMPLNPDNTAQQGNKVFAIVTLKSNITGADIEEISESVENIITVDFDGSPTFVSTEVESGTNTGNDSTSTLSGDLWGETDELPQYGEHGGEASSTGSGSDVNDVNIEDYLGETTISASDIEIDVDVIDTGGELEEVSSATNRADTNWDDEEDGTGVEDVIAGEPPLTEEG